VTAGISGVLIFFDIGKTPVIPVINVSIYGLILFFHVICVFAIITQAAAIAIAHEIGKIKSSKKRLNLELYRPIPCSRKVLIKLGRNQDDKNKYFCL